MSFKYGKTSQSRLETCTPNIRRLFESLIKDYDITIICGHRSKEDQNAAVASGASKTPWPKSKHNAFPSCGIDAALYPIDWNDLGRHYAFGGIVKERARQLGIKIRWGGDWDGDWNTDDQKFNDLVHFEEIM
jgi:peptidoglycan L-alanyl-D-glutamate endopeptidase CwlK